MFSLRLDDPVAPLPVVAGFNAGLSNHENAAGELPPGPRAGSARLEMHAALQSGHLTFGVEADMEIAVLAPQAQGALDAARVAGAGHRFGDRARVLYYDTSRPDVATAHQSMVSLIQEQGLVYPVTVVFGDLVEKFIPPQSYAEQWDLEGLMDVLKNEFKIEIDFEKALKENPNLTEEEIYNAIIAESERQYAEKKKQANADVDPSQFRRFEKSVLLEVLDSQWKEHLAAMDYLRQGIQLRAYGQRRPEQEYKRESFILFEAMLEQIHYKTIRFLSNIVIRVETPEELSEALSAPEKSEKKVIEGSVTNAADVERLIDEIGNISEENIAETEAEIKADMDSGAFAQVGRNEPCPCGSGKRYKDCHGKIS